VLLEAGGHVGNGQVNGKSRRGRGGFFAMTDDGV